MASGDAAHDLSGQWRGRFNYPTALEPVAFEATLTETAGWLTGATREVMARRNALGRTLTATLQGRRSGSSVKFLKLYDVVVAGYDNVAYEGQVNAEGTEIDGRWTVPGAWSGTFLMIRAEATATSRRKAARARI
jgi:hypothetical protein